MKVHVWGCNADGEYRVRKYNAGFQLHQSNITSNRVVHFICGMQDHLIHLKPLGVTACNLEIYKAHIHIKHCTVHVPVGRENKGVVG